jgi:predicted nucleic acid-binding protein
MMVYPCDTTFLIDIGDMDPLIASVALAQGELLITRNIAHFQRVPDLQAEGY